MSVGLRKLLGCSIVVIAAAWIPVVAGAADVDPFTAIKGPIAGTNLADLGVVDANGDGHLDLYTSGHTGRTAMLLGDGRGEFKDFSKAWGLMVDSRIPHLEPAAAVAASPPGLHLFFQGEEMIVRSSRSDVSYSGRIEFVRPVAFEVEGEMSAAGGPTAAGPVATAAKYPVSARIDFTASGPGRLTTRSWFPHHDVRVSLAPDTPLNEVFVGRWATPAYARTMKFALVDRHGLAWSDFDGDGDLDVFVSVGGMVGEAPADLLDELFVQDGTRFRNAIVASGIAKKKGRARRVEWVDYDGDGRLDLYVGNVSTPNQLWRQDAQGKFANVAHDLGLDVEDGDVFRWIDVDGDADPDLLLAIANGPALLFVNDAGRFARKQLDDCGTILPNHMSVGDFDADGDLDVFVADSSMNRIFVADGGSFSGRNATEFGLPARSATGNWVDFDNDGLLDIHLIPGSLRRQTADGRFLAAGLEMGNNPSFGRCAWFDYDGDGDRDPFCTVARERQATQHFHFRNDSKENRGLSVDLVGPPLNRQAIGATLLASVAGRVRRHMVGEADGAHWSQGHYRIYVGLGAAAGVDWLEVTWPDGTRQRLDSPGTDGRSEIRWPRDASTAAPAKQPPTSRALTPRVEKP